MSTNHRNIIYTKLKVKPTTYVDTDKYTPEALCYYERLPSTWKLPGTTIVDAYQAGAIPKTIKLLKPINFVVPAKTQSIVCKIDPHNPSWYNKLCTDVAKACGFNYVDLTVKPPGTSDVAKSMEDYPLKEALEIPPSAINIIVRSNIPTSRHVSPPTGKVEQKQSQLTARDRIRAYEKKVCGMLSKHIASFISVHGNDWRNKALSDYSSPKDVLHMVFSTIQSPELYEPNESWQQFMRSHGVYYPPVLVNAVAGQLADSVTITAKNFHAKKKNKSLEHQLAEHIGGFLHGCHPFRSMYGAFQRCFPSSYHKYSSDCSSSSSDSCSSSDSSSDSCSSSSSDSCSSSDGGKHKKKRRSWGYKTGYGTMSQSGFQGYLKHHGYPMKKYKRRAHKIVLLQPHEGIPKGARRIPGARQIYFLNRQLILRDGAGQEFADNPMLLEQAHSYASGTSTLSRSDEMQRLVTEHWNDVKTGIGDDDFVVLPLKQPPANKPLPFLKRHIVIIPSKYNGSPYGKTLKSLCGNANYAFSADKKFVNGTSLGNMEMFKIQNARYGLIFKDE